MRVTPMTPPPRAGNARRANDARLIPMAFTSQLSLSAFAVIGLGAAAGAWLRWLLGVGDRNVFHADGWNFLAHLFCKSLGSRLGRFR